MAHELNIWVQKRSIEKPEWIQSKTMTQKQGKPSSVQEWTSRAKHEDKQSGSYERITTKEKVSSGEMFVEKPTGRVGYKNELKRTSNVKVGDKSGYTEYYTEQKIQRVNYGKNSKNIGSSTSQPKSIKISGSTSLTKSSKNSSNTSITKSSKNSGCTCQPKSNKYYY